MGERLTPEEEEPRYRAATARGWISVPTILWDERGDRPVGSDRFDAYVFWPRTTSIGGRPDWLITVLGRHRWPLPAPLLAGDGVRLAQAFRHDEPDSAVAVDQVLVPAGSTEVELRLPAGRFRVRTIDRTGRVLGLAEAIIPSPVVVDEIEAAVAVDDRTIIVTAPRSGAVHRIDLDRGTTATLGRRGEGPGEYRWPTQPAVLRDGTIAIVDIQASALVSWRPDGTAGTRRAIRALAKPRVGADGTVYGEATQIIPTGTAVETARDTVALVRARPGTARPDTIGAVTLVRRVVVGPFRGITPDFATDDLWGVTPDGTVWIARAGSNRIERLAPGATTWRASPSRPWTRTRPTKGEERPLQVVVATPPPGFDRLRQPMAREKAPFTHAMADLNGDVWLRLQPAPGDTAARWAVFPANGGPATGTVVLPADRLVIAFSRAYVMTKRETEDGTWAIERWPRSALR